MGKIKTFFRHNYWKFSVILVIFIGIFAFHSLNTKADMMYHLITDNNGITWQYGYNPSNRELEVSFFESRNSISQIVIPKASFFTSNTVNTYTFTNYTDHNLGTPRTFNSTITKIDLSNVNVVNGIHPLSDNTTNTMNIILNPTSSKIGYDVFRDKRIDITNLDKVTDISGGAFYNTTFSNTNIKLPKLNNLGDGSFEQSNISSLEINSYVIGVSAFKNCKNLGTVKLLNNVLTIRASAFEGDTNLTSFDFNNVVLVENRAFKDCTRWNIDIGNTKIEKLGSEVFSGCTNYATTTIPNKVTSLNYRAFYHSGMTNININNVYVIDTQAFDGANLSNIDLKNVEKIGFAAFANNNLTEVYLPKSIVDIYTAAIFYNNPLRKLTIAYDTLKTNEYNGIGTNNHIWVILSGDGTTYPKDEKNASNYLEEVEFIAPYKDNEEIDLSNHLGYNNLKRLYRFESSENLPNGKKVSDYKNVLQAMQLYDLPKLKKVTIGEGYEFIGAQNFAHGKNNSLEEVNLPSTLKGIGYAAFQRNDYNNEVNGYFGTNNPIKINLPESLEYIGYAAFQKVNLVNTKIDLPNLIVLKDNAFQFSNISEIVLHDKLEKVGNNAFNMAPNLKNITFDCDYFSIASNKSCEIGQQFMAHEFLPYTSSYMSNGQMITYRGMAYDTTKPIQLNTIRFTEKAITPPSSSYNMFFNTKVKEIDLENVPWTTLSDQAFMGTDAEIIKLPKNLTTIGKHMFFEAKIDNTLAIPSHVTEIKPYAFMNANIEEIDISQDPNLAKIDEFSFMHTPNIKRIKLYHDLDLTIEAHAFHNSGLNSLNDAEGIDLRSDKITLTGECTFQEMSNIKNLEISKKLNNGIIPVGTFSKEDNLEKVILYDDVSKIRTGAFAFDPKLKTFVMYGDTEIENEDGTQTVELEGVNNVNFHTNTGEYIQSDFTITINNSLTITKNDFSYNSTTHQYTYSYTGNRANNVIIKANGNIILIKGGYDNNITIVENNDYNTTIPSTANLYCYLKNEHCNTWNNTYKSYKQNQNSDLYYLDEVLYLDSNKRYVDLNESGTDIDKDGLTIYALRRDGVILVSENWGELTSTKKYVDSGITIKDYNSNTTDPRLMIFDTNVPLNSIDTTTNNNFSNLSYEIGEKDLETARILVNLVYPNKIVDTTANTVLKTKGNYVDIIYADGCGGESFANVIFEDILIGEKTPNFDGTPTREGYEFIGWDKTISENAEEDIIYTAQWKKIENNYPDINKDIPTNKPNLINPSTKNNIIMIIVSLLILLIVKFRKRLFKGI
ncbi:MAG: leucine-rich repeat domain-containing protein [Bacilli bacterium]|nr:leucine-rich repeat domain-containing protein [Bacilli bacterium]